MVVVALVTVLAIRHAVTSLSLSALVRALADRPLATMAASHTPDDDVPDRDVPTDGEGSEVRRDVMGWVQGVDHRAIIAALPWDGGRSVVSPVIWDPPTTARPRSNGYVREQCSYR